MLPDDVIAEACTAAAVDDFGSDSYREGLDVYSASVTNEAQLSEIGDMAVRSNIVGRLVNRLRVVDWTAQHPEVRDERIDAPLVVIGMFRAGTTFLSYLLEQDPNNRALLNWETGNSVPPPTTSDFRAGPRVEAARVASEMLEQLNPRMRAIHHEEPNGPTECISVMSGDFKSLLWEAMANVPSYGRWLLQTDQRSAYEYHHQVLQVLQSGGVRGRWTLKTPHHAIALEALTAVYPDAQLVLLHRDPVALCASVCSLITELSGCFTDADHRAYITDHWVALLETSVDRINAFRAGHPEHPIVDVQYDALVRDPVGTVESIYGAFGDRMSASTEEALRAYAAAHPKNALGAHAYTLEQFGLDPAEIRERFSDYVKRYDVVVD